MSFSSIADMLSAAQERTQPLYAVIRDADCLENGYDAAASHRQIAALWAAMQASSRQYCADDRSNSGLIGGDAEKLRTAAEKGLLLGGTYFQRVTEQALKVAECNACMKRIVAAPTAGLHFTDELRETLRQRGFQWAEVTLYVGYGTFSPVRCEDIRNHQMHREYVELPEETANAIAEAKAQHRPVIAVGTTSVRTLEGVAQVCGRAQPFAGWTDIFLYPGRPFRVVDGIITNFHLPESSLLMLVSAFAGRKRILEAYQEAVKEGYRFFSYGDAMLIR